MDGIEMGESNRKVYDECATQGYRRGIRMRARNLFSLVVLVAIAAVLAIPTVVKAPEVTIGAGDTYSKSYDLKEYGWITWYWTTEGLDEVDFWVEDSDGGRYSQEYNEWTDSGTFTADTAGKYYLKWENDGSSPVVVDYTITTWGLEKAEEMVSGLVWAAAITGIIILVVVIVVIVAVLQAGKKKAPAQQQYPQQQYYQQQQYQQPYQQPYQQQYPQQQYPQQPQEPQQPGQQYPPEQ